MNTTNINNTPKANRLHIALYGNRNSGKSSLLNFLTDQDFALVSPIAGTTTDTVYKNMELSQVGPCVFLDTAGFDDEGTLGLLRVEQTKKTLNKVDIALMLINSESLAALFPLNDPERSLNNALQTELQWMKTFSENKIPLILLVSKADLLTDAQKKELIQPLTRCFGIEPIYTSVYGEDTVDSVRKALLRAIPEDFEKNSITGELAKAGDLVLLVMPQDIQAPKGRLILPQVQTIRDLLDKECIVTSCTTDTFENALFALSKAPDLIITDSQVVRTVLEKKPTSSKLTTFSILFADYKGDLPYYILGAKAIEKLTKESRVLIAEACTHAPLTEDIGRVKIPRLLRKKAGEELTIDFVRGADFPEDLSQYDLIIHCGACMFNRRYVLSRTSRAKAQAVPMTNYGVAIAHLTGALSNLDI
ncbi:MAG: [FeFe] hydrogenase H-cluster maturation GTPase HydF [Clostridia bacterium]